MSMPIGIQRQRVKGWRLPENTVCVDRSTIWGNPNRVGEIVNGAPLSAAQAVSMYEADISVSSSKLKFSPKDLWKLRGKNLACFCGLDQLCHRDVLLRLANPDKLTDIEAVGPGITL